ncbi:MAG TPA: helix-turn-helix transcriptional regulator [Acidimicrobiia bacterium]|jgi:transcriptional regulator with XRE-family HTH domain
MARRPATTDSKSFGVAFGAAVRARRDKKGWTAQRLAEVSGLSVDGVRRIEVGRVTDPGIQTVNKIATALTTTVDALLRATREGES